MKNLSKAAAVAVATTAMSLTPVMASSPGQLQDGSGTYVVKNVTQNGSYSTSIKANACDELEYSIKLHNVNYGELTNINVKATLANSGSSNMTATPDSGTSFGTSGSVNVDSGSATGVAYENGSTELFNGSGQLIKPLDDGITSGGVNVGNLAGSTTEFVNFKVKVNCSTPTPPSTPTTPSTPAQPAALPQTGADELAGVAGMAGTGAVGYGVVMYRRSKKALADKLRNRK